jgi:hypothetical protein
MRRKLQKINPKKGVKVVQNFNKNYNHYHNKSLFAKSPFTSALLNATEVLPSLSQSAPGSTSVSLAQLSPTSRPWGKSTRRGKSNVVQWLMEHLR